MILILNLNSINSSDENNSSPFTIYLLVPYIKFMGRWDGNEINPMVKKIDELEEAIMEERVKHL